MPQIRPSLQGDTAKGDKDAKQVFPDWVCAVSSSSCTLAAEPPAPSSWVLSPGSRAELRRRMVNMILNMI